MKAGTVPYQQDGRGTTRSTRLTGTSLSDAWLGRRVDASWVATPCQLVPLLTHTKNVSQNILHGDSRYR